MGYEVTIRRKREKVNLSEKKRRTCPGKVNQEGDGNTGISWPQQVRTGNKDPKRKTRPFKTAVFVLVQELIAQKAEAPVCVAGAVVG